MADTLTNLLFGNITLMTAIIWLVIATIISMIGGAISGMVIAGKDIGYQFSAMLGSMFAPAGVIPALILGLFIINFINLHS